MLMEFNVPVFTTAQPPRAKSAKTVLASVLHRVEIPEYSSEEAPLAIRCRFEGDDNDRGYEIDYRDYREINDRLFVDMSVEMTYPLRSDYGTIQQYDSCRVPFRTLGEHIKKRLLDLDNPRSNIYPSEYAGQFARERFLNKPFPELHSLGLIDYNEAEVQRCLALFDDEVSRLVFVDGKLHALEPAPVIMVNRGNGGEVTAVRRKDDGPLSIYNDDSGEWNTSVAYFRMDQSEDALAFAESIPGRFTPELQHLYVSDTAPTGFDGPAATLHSIAVSMNETIVVFAETHDGRALLNSLTPTVMELYNTFERELRQYDGTSDHQVLADAVEQVLSLDEAGRKLFVPPELLQATMAAFELWQDRPIILDARRAMTL